MKFLYMNGIWAALLYGRVVITSAKVDVYRYLYRSKQLAFRKIFSFSACYS